MKSSYLLAKIFITGGIVLGLELAASRIMTPFFGVSLYVWSSILSVTLIALALGYKFGGDIAARMPTARLELLYASAGGLAALWIVLCLWTYPVLFQALAKDNLVLGSIAACFYLLFIPLVILSGLNSLLVALLSPGKKKGGDHGAGQVFFVSTIGSVFGVFVVAYVLLQWLTNYETVAFLALSSALLSVAMLLAAWKKGKDSWKSRALAMAILAFLLAAGTFLSGGLERFSKDVHANGVVWNVLETKPSYFGNMKIVEMRRPESGGSVTALLNDGLVQNRFSAPGVSASPYTYALEQISYATAIPDPKTALVLGIGGGIVPVSFDRAGLAVDAVDINKNIVELAEEYLGFERGNINIIIEDARVAVRRCAKKYDIVVVDLFHADGVPEHLVTREFFSDIHNCMNKDGVMVMNSFMSEEHPEPGHALLQTISSVFGGVYFLPGGNAYFVARNGAPVQSLDISLAALPQGLVVKLSASLQQARAIKQGDPDLKGAPVITDVSNQWKRIARPMEENMRSRLVMQMPWQVLVN